MQLYMSACRLSNRQENSGLSVFEGGTTRYQEMGEIVRNLVKNDMPRRVPPQSPTEGLGR